MVAFLVYDYFVKSEFHNVFILLAYFLYILNHKH